MKEQGKVKISVFLMIAIVEHLIFTLVLALAVYTEPVSKPDNAPISVDVLINEQEKQRMEEEFPIAIPAPQRIELPEELPPVHSTSRLQRYFNSTQSTGGLPDLPPTRSPNRYAERSSLGGASVQGRNRNLLDDVDAIDATVPTKPLAEQAGHHGASGRQGLPDVETRKMSRGERGPGLTGNVSKGQGVSTGPTRVTGGAGFEIEIFGEVSGRGYRLGSPIQIEGKQGGGVQLSFKVRPDGTVFDVRIKPGSRTTVGESRLKEEAKRYVTRIRFDPLPKGVSQVDQSGEIFINFTTQMNR